MNDEESGEWGECFGFSKKKENKTQTTTTTIWKNGATTFCFTGYLSGTRTNNVDAPCSSKSLNAEDVGSARTTVRFPLALE